MANLDHLLAKSWDREYRERGKLWQGPAHFEFTLPAGARVLELGCGNGKTLSALPVDSRVTAIDISPQAVALTGEVIAQRKMSNANAVVADVRALPFADASFDAVIAFHVLEHMLAVDRARAVAEMARVLAPGGMMFVKCFSTNDMRFGKGTEIEPATFTRGKNDMIYHYFTEAELDAMFAGVGLSKRSSQLVRWRVHYAGVGHWREKLLVSYAKMK